MGASVVPGGVFFRVWAPAAKQVEVVVQEPAVELPMDREADGTWALRLEGGQAGTRYKYRIDSGGEYPDPYSRYQPEGVHGRSEVVDPRHFAWHDADWPGLDPHELVIYECHTGTFTPEGTFEAAIQKLPYVRDLGVTALELMPVAEFSGRRNWGYDGVDWFAPSRSYGGPAGLQRLIDTAHQHGVGVLLDVVYNHFGPEGNYLRQFSPDYFTDRYETPWGAAINYDGPGSEWARKLAIDNACYWLREYHVDGLRLDATFAIFDSSAKDVLRELAEAIRSQSAKAILIAETHENDVGYLRGFAQGGYGFDAVWADDFHHTLRRRLAGDRQGYYADYAGTTAEIARTLNQGFLYEGQRSSHLGRGRGTPARDCPARQFVYCVQNHDQVGNRAFGDRLNHDIPPDLYRLASAVLLLAPYTPLLFMGQEFAASSPFQYFTDHSPDLGKLVTEGRRREFQSFASFVEIPDPQAEQTFVASKLRWEEAEDSPIRRLYRECLRLRREDKVLRLHDRFRMSATAVGEDVLSVSYDGGPDRRLLVANFGEPVTVPAAGLSEVLLDTSDVRFGGSGTTAQLKAGRLMVPARSAVLLG
jgi:maltooligosyltrehalose trehalohydrolase